MSSEFLYPDKIADPSLVEAENAVCEVPTEEEPPLCEGVGFCDQDDCIGCSATWTCFPINPMKTWKDMNEEEREFIKTHYPAWVGV